MTFDDPALYVLKVIKASGETAPVVVVDNPTQPDVDASQSFEQDTTGATSIEIVPFQANKD